MTFDDTIVAQATPLGQGGVAIVRLSGSDAFGIAARFCQPAQYSNLLDVPVRFMAGASVHNGNQTVDQCLVVRFKELYSYTGENIVELHLHGSPLIVDQVIALAFTHGARLARPGEFTLRAFLNGKLDLTQVEALADILTSESEQALLLSQRQLHGDFRRKIDSFRQKIIDILSLLELELDFVEDGYTFGSPENLRTLFNELEGFARDLLDGYAVAARLRRGPRILLLGRPNAGKSSLFNAILGYGRALVSSVPGTTRDYLEETIVFNGVTLHFVDTAGLHFTDNAIEASGIERARELASLCDHILYLTDSNANSIEEDEIELAQFSSAVSSSMLTRVFTKRDLSPSPAGDISVSVFDPASIKLLLQYLVDYYHVDVSHQLVLLNARQAQLCEELIECIVAAKSVLTSSTEVVSAELRMLLRPLSELTGAIVNDDVLNHIFSAFCIGK